MILAGYVLIWIAGFFYNGKNIIEHRKTKQPVEPLREV